MVLIPTYIYLNSTTTRIQQDKTPQKTKNNKITSNIQYTNKKKYKLIDPHTPSILSGGYLREGVTGYYFYYDKKLFIYISKDQKKFHTWSEFYKFFSKSRALNDGIVDGHVNTDNNSLCIGVAPKINIKGRAFGYAKIELLTPDVDLTVVYNGEYSLHETQLIPDIIVKSIHSL